MRPICLILPLLSLSPLCGEEAFTLSLAREQVDREVAKVEEREERKRSDLLATPSLSETKETLPSGSAIVLRQVSSPPGILREFAKTVSPEAENGATGFPREKASGKPWENVSISVTVFDDKISEIRLWHEGETYSVLSNVAFSHLQVLSTFEDDCAQWSLFTVVSEVDEEQEKRLAREAKHFGAEYTPRKRPDISVFTSLERPEYLVYPAAGQLVPDRVLAKLDAIHTYYLANEIELAAEHRRREALAEARRRYQEENPPKPKDIVINFWRE